MKTRIHVNAHLIRSNKKHGTKHPVVTAKTYKDNFKGNEVVIHDKEGKEVARVVYRPHKPLSCGAVCWIETDLPIKIES